MSYVVDTCVIVAAVVFGLYGYDLLVSLAGFLPLRRPAPNRETRFAVVVCAHNEAAVIGATVRSLLDQDYPADQIDLFVVADNCSDDTAQVARDSGAIVLERFDTSARGKGYALQWGMAQVAERGTYGALCVFDADNLVERDFFALMSGHLAEGHVAIQGYLDTKNPDDTWVTRCIALAYFVTNRFWFRARMRLGLQATLGGTGYCLRWDVFERYRSEWDPGALTDDLDLSMRLTYDRVRVSYSYFARTYDEKPPGLQASIRQRTRWMQGHVDVAWRWFARLAWAAVRRPSWRCLDAALYLLQPLRLLVSVIVLLALGVAWFIDPSHPLMYAAFRLTLPGWSLWLALFVVYPLVVAGSERALGLALRCLVPFIGFGFTWVPAIAVGAARFRHRVWAHTTHGSLNDPRRLAAGEPAGAAPSASGVAPESSPPRDPSASPGPG